MLRLVKYIKHLWWALLISTIFIICQAWLQLMLPDYMSNILKTMQDLTISQSEKMSQIWYYGGIMIAICLGVLISAVAVQIINSIVGAIYARNIREAVFKKVMSFSMHEFNQFGTASLLTRTTNDINILKDTFTMFTRNVVFSPVILIVAIVKAILLDWQLSMVFLVALPVLALVIVVVFVIASPLFTQIQTKLDN